MKLLLISNKPIKSKCNENFNVYSIQNNSILRSTSVCLNFGSDFRPF